MSETTNANGGGVMPVSRRRRIDLVGLIVGIVLRLSPLLAALAGLLWSDR